MTRLFPIVAVALAYLAILAGSVNAQGFSFGPLAPNSDVLWNRYVIPFPIGGENIRHESDLFVPSNCASLVTWDLYVDDLGDWLLIDSGFVVGPGNHIITIDKVHNRQPGDRQYKLTATYYDMFSNKFTTTLTPYVPEQ